MRIAVDGMGGDYAPKVVVEGAILAATEYGFEVVIVGDKARIDEELSKAGSVPTGVTVHHASEVIGMDEPGATSARNKKDSSICVATDLVKEGKADAVVSAGNTAAFVSAAIMSLRRLPGVERPGIAVLLPSMKGPIVMIDCGATINPEPSHLMGFGLMGDVYVRHILGKKNPSIGLLNIGEESNKGPDFLKETHLLLESSKLNFQGNAEGRDIFAGKFDVIVCDGYTGNVVLKVAESIASTIGSFIKDELKRDPLRILGGLLTASAFTAVKRQMDYAEHGGAPLLGVNGICIISHGRSSAKAIKNAIRVAGAFVEHQVNQHILESVKKFHDTKIQNNKKHTGITAGITGLGAYLPKKVLTNADLEKLVDTSDEWIRTRTGISERRIADEKEVTSDLAANAARMALKDAKLEIKDVELIILASISPDMPFPATSCIVQAKLGAVNAACFDINAACSGFIHELAIAQQFVESGMYKNVLVIGAELLSRFTDWKDRNTCVLFGDGAGAAVIAPVRSGGIISSYLGADGTKSQLLMCPAGGSVHPASHKTVTEGMHFLKMQGNDVFKNAVRVMTDACSKVLHRSGLTAKDIDCVIPHQANIRIIEAVLERVKIPMEKVFVNVDRYGNMSAASAIVALFEAVKEGRVKKGDKVLLVAFGSGFVWGSCIIEW